VCCHSARSTCQETILASHNEPAVSDVPKLELLVDSLTRWDKLLVYYPFAIKETNEHCSDFWFLHLHFLGAGWSWTLPLHALLLCLRVILKNLTFILINDSNQLVIIPLICCRRSAYASLLHCSWLSVTFLDTVFSQTFFVPKIFHQNQLYSLSVDIQFLCNHYDINNSTPQFSLFNIFVQFWCCRTSRSVIKLNFILNFPTF
jgi:hypothetical protein